jgi:hypothetical protein
VAKSEADAADRYESGDEEQDYGLAVLLWRPAGWLRR